MAMSEELIPLVAIGGGILIAIVAIVCGTLVSLYKIHRQSNLKQAMLEAGMAPHEIERVINCGQMTNCENQANQFSGKPAKSY